jgi:hypothetical protein
MHKLGFGMMRLPLLDPKQTSQIDVPQVSAMADAFLAQGFTYFDTAYGYHGGESERAVREAVVRRHDRSAFALADKMPLFRFKAADTAADQEKLFREQLEKCGVDFFDNYLLHCVDTANYEIAKRLDTFAFLSRMKEEGKIRRLGFSFHDKADVLDRVLTEHPEAEFVQLQINYLDWEDERVQSRKCYETARRHGKPVVVMEPVKGGRLARLPQEAAELLARLHPDWTPAAWALRFAAGLEGVDMVLSGMSDMAQLEENTRIMAAPEPLTAEELEALARAAEIISAAPVIACTACGYCADGCPRQIPIPELFSLYNEDQLSLRQGRPADREKYQSLTEGRGRASGCVSCRQCERQCPQHLEITSWLERVKNTYEG